MNRILLVICLACVVSSAFAQQPGRVMTLTRTVKRFSEFENQLDDARHGHDDAALSKLLAASFEQRSAGAPSAPTPRAEWLAQPSAKEQINQMAVHEYGDVAVVSFAEGAQQAFIVDVWTKTGDSYALSVRYTSAAPAAAAQTQPENPAK